jgi:hypothetical protein
MAQVLAVSEGKTWSWGDFARGPWNLVAVPLTLIVLVDLTARLINWAASIQWLADEYETWRALAFSRSPIAIPFEWDDYVVLLCVFFSVTNVSYRRRTGRSFITDLLSFGVSRSLYEVALPRSLSKGWQTRIDDLAALVTGCAAVALIALLPAYCFLSFMSFFVSFHISTIVAYGKWPLVLTLIVGSGFLIAWRWLLTIGLLFALLMVGNGVYLHWLGGSEFLTLRHLPLIQSLSL